MKTKLLYMAVLMAAAFITVSCEKERKNLPLLSYYQVDGGPKYAIKWSAVESLSPQDGEYDIALSVGKPFREDNSTDPPRIVVVPLNEMTDVFTFTIPSDKMGQDIMLPNGTNAAINFSNPSTGFYTTANGTIAGGILNVTRSGSKFTIDFQFNLYNGRVITGRHEGALIEHYNVHIN